MDFEKKDFGKKQKENELLASQRDYLWDCSGAPDPEIERLETLLGAFRHDQPAPIFPALAPRRQWSFFSRQLLPGVAAALAAAAVAIVIFAVLGRRSDTAVAGWDVSSVDGTPRIGGDVVDKRKRLAVGQVLETDSQSRARLQAGEIGRITVEPGTRLRLLSMGEAFKRIALDRGTIHAYIWAPPGEFVVDTPSALTVDLGCAYTLHVDDSGAGLVRTTRGWVGFTLNGHESFIPAGAACATRPKIGPGTPYFEDASSDLRAALDRFDFGDSTPQQHAADLAGILARSRKRDALTLWHLLTRVDESQRLLVYERLRTLAPPPSGVTRDGILRLDQSMLDRWWNELGFDDIAVWRHWERSWPEKMPSAGEK